jgi:hypothetical protein
MAWLSHFLDRWDPVARCSSARGSIFWGHGPAPMACEIDRPHKGVIACARFPAQASGRSRTATIAFQNEWMSPVQCRTVTRFREPATASTEGSDDDPASSLSRLDALLRASDRRDMESPQEPDSVQKIPLAEPNRQNQGPQAGSGGLQRVEGPTQLRSRPPTQGADAAPSSRGAWDGHRVEWRWVSGSLSITPLASRHVPY